MLFLESLQTDRQTNIILFNFFEEIKNLAILEREGLLNTLVPKTL